MKRRIAAVALTVLLLTAAGAGAQPAAADGERQSASGFGQVHLGLPFRNFSFSASTQADGTVTGQAQLMRQDLGVRVHVEIDCLNVLGDIAVVSGVVKSTNSPVLPIGLSQLFAVRDTGEGPDAPPDEITLVFDGLGIPCTALPPVPAVLEPFFIPIENGQVQVRR